ncbi:GNAT family N-acetyltransferase [Vibrio sagamiensis]|uniref:Acyltransferase n=1 Tax=Vibrio sagamiensis NBRC 104589 TaxID=1219064 RepID=A0A511QK55_9VIBR|nr:GNAT family N-acetyltransferase [Vibrio sagamiensis]PNQ54595.1 N-acetyltransferase [Vibrio agarivorans]GEM77661.1 acyltransferase [Vibrio sagamiensis NBRC 104589]
MPDSLHIEELPPLKLPLIKKLYKQYYPAGKAKSDELILTATQAGNIVALLRLKNIDCFRLLTGMLVIPDYRGTGVGKSLLAHCKQHIFKESDYCFAFSHLKSYYSQYGFKNITADELPQSLRTSFLRYVESGKDLIPMQFSSEHAVNCELL